MIQKEGVFSLFGERFDELMVSLRVCCAPLLPVSESISVEELSVEVCIHVSQGTAKHARILYFIKSF